MDYVGLLNMGLNWKEIYHIYPPNVGLYLKIKENTLWNTWATTLTTTWGTGAISKPLKKGRRDKRPLTQRNGYIHTQVI